MDQQLRAAQAEPDVTKRAQMLKGVMRILYDEVAWIPLMHAQGRWLVRSGIRMETRLDRMLLAHDITSETTFR